jgi:tRNA A-37 threonylcarbamoyl transferase component Bud32
MLRTRCEEGVSKTDLAEARELHQCAIRLADQQLPPGWEVVGSSGFAVVAHHRVREIYYKEFLPRSPIEQLKALIKGSRGTRARRQNDALLTAGFNAPVNLAWGKLSAGREYVFTRAVSGSGVDRWLRETLNTDEGRPERREFLHEMGILVGRFHATGFIHGDMRTSNVLANRTLDRLEFSLIDNERNGQSKPAPGKQLLKNLMQLNMHTPTELSRSDRMRFFRAWHSQMRDISKLEAKLLAAQAYQWAMRRLKAKGKL